MSDTGNFRQSAEALSCTSASCGCWFRFIGALFKSLEMVSMQSGVDVGAGAGTGEGVLNVREDILGYISRRRRSVMSTTCLYLPQFRERTGQRSSDLSIARRRRCAQYSTTRVSAVLYSMRPYNFTSSLRFPSSRSAAVRPPTNRRCSR